MTHPAEPEQPFPTELISDVLWKRLQGTSLEHFRLSKVSDSYVLQGLVLVSADAAPLQVHYLVMCDSSWVTTDVHVTAIEGERHRRLQLERDNSGAWRDNNEVLTEFADLVDIDLQITPATNTLPIRRLGLEIGESADIDAVWIRFPDLSLERLSQRYTRTTERRYTYESGGGSFRADLEVDQHGVVVRYDGIWERVQA